MGIWQGLGLKQKMTQKTSLIFIAFILFYGLQGIASIFIKGLAPYHDLFVVAFLLASALILHIVFKFDIEVPILMGIGFAPHILGLYQLPSIGSLYGLAALNYHYDWIVHSLGMFCFTLAFCSIIYPYFGKVFKSKMVFFFFATFFMSGLGAFNETLEFVGYDMFGYGEGFLEFGDGDSSPDAGPWQNASMDLVTNLIGIIVAIGLFFLARFSKNIKIRKTPKGI
jgi:hypothetical protein